MLRSPSVVPVCTAAAAADDDDLINCHDSCCCWQEEEGRQQSYETTIGRPCSVSSSRVLFD